MAETNPNKAVVSKFEDHLNSEKNTAKIIVLDSLRKANKMAYQSVKQFERHQSIKAVAECVAPEQFKSVVINSGIATKSIAQVLDL